jgi:hypothetical protein
MQENVSRTIVRIWSSRVNPKYDGGGVGHISIELERPDEFPFYISLFPYDISTLNVVTNRIPQELHALEDDMAIEGKPPQILICFYTLNNNSIMDRFDHLTETLQGWSIIGNLFQFKSDKKESCASLAYKLLQAGDNALILPSLSEQSKQAAKGISWMLRSPLYCSEMSAASLVTSPDFMIEYLKQAKLKECEKRPEFRGVLIPNETDFSTLVPCSSRCSLM